VEIELEQLSSGGSEPPVPESGEGTSRTVILLLGGVAVALIILFWVARPDPGETAAGTPRTSTTTTLATTTTSAVEPTTTEAPTTTRRSASNRAAAITIGDQYVGEDGHDRIRVLAFPSQAVQVDGGWLATSERPGLFFSEDGLDWSREENYPTEHGVVQLHSDGENVFVSGVDRNMTRSWLREPDGSFTPLDTVPVIGRESNFSEIVDVSLTGVVAGNNVELSSPIADEELSVKLADIVGMPVDPSVCSLVLTAQIDFLNCEGEVVETHRFARLDDNQINCLFNLSFQSRSRARLIIDDNDREGAMELTPGAYLAGLHLVDEGAVALVAGLDRACTAESIAIQLMLLNVNGQQTVLTELTADLTQGANPQLVRRDGALHLLVDNRAFVVSNAAAELLDEPVELERPEAAEDGRFVIGAGPLIGFVEAADGRLSGRVWLSADNQTWTEVQIEPTVIDIRLLASSSDVAVLSVLGPLASELARIPLR